MHFHILSVFFFQCNTVELKCILLGSFEREVPRKRSANRGRRNLQNDNFHDLLR
jgi:hypothetical protein